LNKITAIKGGGPNGSRHEIARGWKASLVQRHFAPFKVNLNSNAASVVITSGEIPTTIRKCPDLEYLMDTRIARLG
jgi:hypothetical protein